MLLFLLVSLISFAGSIHPGTVNLAVIQTTLAQNRRAGLWLALGGSLPEIGYSLLAAGGLMLLPTHSDWNRFFTYSAIPVLLGAGIAAFRQKPVDLTTSTPSHTSSLPFLKGLVLSGTNPQLLPFWSAMWLYLSQASIGSHRLIPAGQSGSQWVFALGAATGAFVLLTGAAWLADRQRQRVLTYLSGRWINYLTGSLFVGMALWQTIRAFYPSESTALHCLIAR